MIATTTPQKADFVQKFIDNGEMFDQMPLEAIHLPDDWISRNTRVHNGSNQIRWWWEGVRGEWIDLPTLGEVEDMVLDSVCSTPMGNFVEPDDPHSWLSVLGII